MRLIFAIIIVSTTAFVSAACYSGSEEDCPKGSERWIEYQLFMGRSGPDGAVVDDEAWESFLADTVTPSFPDGLTVLDAKGQWRGSSGEIQREASKQLIILAPSEDKGAADRIEQIANDYKTQFEQESVLKTVSETCVSF